MNSDRCSSGAAREIDALVYKGATNSKTPLTRADRKLPEACPPIGKPKAF
jgi:hypothetical protein